MEQVEDHYKQETKDLLNTVKRLQDENRKLSNSLVAANERDSAFSEDGKCIDIVIGISAPARIFTLKSTDLNLKFVTYSFFRNIF